MLGRLSAFALAAFLGFARPAQAEGLENALPAPYPAPELSGITGWINSEPLTLSSLKGKVVLVDFWTYSCINCIRTLPHLTAWDAAYRKDGLVILGVHSPEFRFEQERENVARAVERFGIQYPVALDSDMETWRAFDNHYWPAHYLIDREGRVVYTHFGEGKYEITEGNIRALLGLGAAKDAAGSTSGALPYDELQTPETYLGHARAERFYGAGGLVKDASARYSLPTNRLPPDHWALQGSWRVEAERMTASEPGAALRISFHARHVYLVLGTERGTPVRAKVTLDGQDLPVVTVDGHRLYELATLPRAADGVLEVTAQDAGLEAYAFTFGN